MALSADLSSIRLMAGTKNAPVPIAIMPMPPTDRDGGSPWLEDVDALAEATAQLAIW